MRCVAFEDAQAAARLYVPQPNSPFIIARERAALIGAPRYVIDTGRMAFEHAQTAARFYVPQPHGPIIISREGTFPIWTERIGIDTRALVVELDDAFGNLRAGGFGFYYQWRCW